MGRKSILILILLTTLSGLRAQNLQLHFDPRHALAGDKAAPTNYLTATFEMFKPDKWGSTFMFIDFDFNYDAKSPGLIYGEIARDFKIGHFPLQPHIEYNGGLGLVRNTSIGFSIPNAYLAGASYPFKLGNFFMGTYLAYKLNAFSKRSHDAQWTATWSGTLAKGKVSLSGFLDLWTENKDKTGTTGKKGKEIILLSEPQIWYNISPKLSIGSEVEVSYNFVNKFSVPNHFFVLPTLAAKWNF